MLLAACFSAWYGTRVYELFQNWWYPVPTTVDFDYPFDQSAFDIDMPNPVPTFIDSEGSAEDWERRWHDKAADVGEPTP
jgi:hypothetical protein